jgi:proline iminopeptidase
MTTDEMTARERVLELEEGAVDADDTTIAYVAVGSGKPLVAVHGGPGIGHAYLRGLDVFVDEYRVLYYDQRGSGRTALGDEEKVTFAGALADLEALRQGLGIERLNLIGHSFGALVALLYASRHTDRVGSLVLYSSGPPFVPELVEEFRTAMTARRTPQDDAERERLEQSEEFARREPKTLERYVLNSYLPFFDDRASSSNLDMGFTEITAANVLPAGERIFRDFQQHDPLGSLAKIACPTLVLYCENDPLPEAFSRLLADEIREAEYAYLPDTNHFAHVENPEAFASTIRPFLGKHAV